MMSAGTGLDLRVLIYPEWKWWLAHCLELDIVAEGATPEDADEALAELCAMQIEAVVAEGDLDSIVRPAPTEYWRMFYRAERTDAPSAPPRLTNVDRIEVRRLSAA